ncbi:MAG: hypothetical protein WD066_09450 [Planctomycetaceae bacterium]
MTIAAADEKKLLPQLERLVRAVEELLATGLTTASEGTREALGVTFREASRLKLLRLASTLRIADEELGRFMRNDAEFSRRRLVFFLSRAWLLGKGIGDALRREDAAALDRFSSTPKPAPVERLEVVALGVAKKVAAGAFCAFEFRLRTIADAGDLPAGSPLVWSCVFPLKPGVDVPPEAYLTLPQKQKFPASLFLERKTIAIEGAAIARDEFGTARIALGEKSLITAGEPFADWNRFLNWSPVAALERVRDHVPSPFELEVELHEEVVLRDWLLGEEDGESREGRVVRPVDFQGVPFDASVSSAAEGEAARSALATVEEALEVGNPPPPLLGVLHYESCRLVLNPLTLFRPAAAEEQRAPKKKRGQPSAPLETNDEPARLEPHYITVSEKAFDRRALLRSLDLT